MTKSIRLDTSLVFVCRYIHIVYSIAFLLLLLYIIESVRWERNLCYIPEANSKNKQRIPKKMCLVIRET